MASSPSSAPQGPGLASPARTPQARPRTRARIIWLALVAVAVLVAVLVALVAVGSLVLPSTDAPTVTITSIDWNILQPQTHPGNQSGGPFGPNWINETYADGLPLKVSSGAVFSLSLTMLATSNHTIFSIGASVPFSVTATSPSLPTTPAGVDDFLMKVYLKAPSVSADQSVALLITINALTPP
jgi:hypothetical protein